MADAPRPHRPARYADLTELIDAASEAAGVPVSAGELASATAEAVVRAGRSGTPQGLVDLADRVGLDTLAELWRDADPVSLPGALWALYLLRQWCQDNGAEVTALWRAGEPAAGADAVVAGVPAYADVNEVQAVADAVLGGAYTGDFAVALERAAALFRVLAGGRRQRAENTADAPGELDRARRNDGVADALAAAARQWRAGTLR